MFSALLRQRCVDIGSIAGSSVPTIPISINKMDKYCCTDSQKSRSAHFRPLENSKSLGCEVSRSQSDTRTSDSTFTRMREVDTREAATKIWIIGSSYVHRGEKAAHEIFGQNFGLNATVEWFGKGGMRWSGVLPRFYGELAKQSPPDILVVHAGGNDLGLTPPSKLASQMQRQLMQLHKEFPSMTILFSCINERQMWRYGPPQNINNDRKMVNSLMRKAVGCFGGELIEHPLLRFFNTKIFLQDGVHFTDEGNSIFLSSIHGALNKIL